MAKKLNYGDLYTLRRDGRYQGYYRDKDGKRRAVCDRDPERLHRRLQELAEPAPYTFADIATAWHDWIWDRLRDGTRVCYSPAFKRAVALFGDRVASDIQPYEIRNHLERLRAQDYSAKTIETQRVVYRSIFRHAVIDKDLGRQVRTNPAELVPLPQNMKKPEKRDAADDAVLATIRRSADDYFGLFPLLLASTGMRRGEALALQWADVGKDAIRVSKQLSYESGVRAVTEPKTDAGVRTVPILPDLARHLEMPKNAKPTDYLFHGEDPAKPLNLSTFRRRWNHYCKDHGLDLTPHVLRHSYATMLFEAKVDVYTAQKLLGHADIETTMAVYTHLRERQKNESIDRLREHVMAELMADSV